MMPRLDEQNRRIFAAAIANTLGHGGGKVVCDITGLSKPTLTKGPGNAPSLGFVQK